MSTARQKILSVSIHDCRVDTFRSGGAGGQNQNKRDTGVRITHEPSGAVGESREERSQLQNKRTAFVRMAKSEVFRVWVKLQAANAALVEDAVERAMRPANLRVEVRDDAGRWVEERTGDGEVCRMGVLR